MSLEDSKFLALVHLPPKVLKVTVVILRIIKADWAFTALIWRGWLGDQN
jgi:hypothetical protein